MIDRIKRLETLFLEEINTLITKMAANGDFGGFVTITAVRLSKDLTHAKVFFFRFRQSGRPQKNTRSPGPASQRNRCATTRAFTFETNPFVYF